MNEPSFLESPTIDAERRLNEICDAFEAAWKAATDESHVPLLAEFLGPNPDGTLAEELVTLDIFYRTRRGETLRVEDYLAQMPCLDRSWLESALRAKSTWSGESQRTQLIPHVRRSSLVFTLPREFGEFDLIEEIARGGMGVVFKARHRRLNRVVALKMIAAGLLATASQIQRFQIEAEAAARLEHPHIVPIHEIGECEGHHFFTMRYIEGGHLGHILPRLKFEPTTVARLMTQIADAIQHAHSKGIIHRDLKPANILLEGDLEGPLDRLVPFVADFGLAKPFDETLHRTSSNGLLGTPAYMAPEQAAGNSRSVSTTTDVYGLGVILYAMLTGNPPFSRPTLAQLLDSVQHQDPTLPRGLNDKSPVDLETICLKAMRKDPNQRYPSSAEFAADLRRYLQGEPIQARPVSTCERVWKWTKRQPVVAGLLVSLAVVVNVGLGLVFWKWSEAEANGFRAETKAKAETEANERTQKALKKVRSSEYFQRVLHAHLELQGGNALAARQTLENCDPELRGWEWKYVHAQLNSAFWVFSGSGGVVTAVDLSPDGRHLAIASGRALGEDHQPRLIAETDVPRIEIFDLLTEKRVMRMDVRSQILRLIYSPDGNVLYSIGGNSENTTPPEKYAWDARTGKILWNPSEKTASYGGIQLSPDGKTLAESIGKSIRLWDTATFRAKEPLTCPASVHGLAFSGDGRRLAGAHKGGFTIFDINSKDKVKSTTHTVQRNGDFRSIAWHPHEDSLAVGTFLGHVFHVDTESGESELLANLASSRNRGVYAIKYSPKGTHVCLAGASGAVYVYSTETKKRSAVLQGHTREIRSLAFSPGGHLLASGSWDGTVKIWDPLAKKEKAATGALPGRVLGLATTPDGKQVVSASHLPDSGGRMSSLALWDIAKGTRTDILSERVGGFISVAFQREGLLAHDRGREIVLKQKTGNLWRDWLVLPGHDDRIMGFSFHPRKSELASVGRDGAAKVWRWRSEGIVGKTLEATTLDGPAAALTAVAFTSDGQYLLASDHDGNVFVWNEHYDLVRSWKAEEGAVLAMAVHPARSELATGTADGSIVVWDFLKATKLCELTGHVDQITGLAFTPDGSRLASSGNDGDIRIWDPISGELALSFHRQANAPASILFSRDGETLMVGDGGNTSLQFLTTKDLASQRSKRVHGWHAVEASAAETVNQHARAEFHLSELLAENPGNVSVRLRRAWVWAEMGKWDLAAEEIRQIEKVKPFEGSFMKEGFKHAWLLKAFGSQEEIRATCERVMAQYDDSPSSLRNYGAGVICGFRPGSVADPSRLVRMVKIATDSDADKSYFWETLAVAHLRAGEWKPAIQAAERVRKIEKKGRGIESFVEAMAYHHLNDPTQAIACYVRGQGYMFISGAYERKSQTRYYDYLSFQREAAKTLNLPVPPLTPLTFKGR